METPGEVGMGNRSLGTPESRYGYTFGTIACIKQVSMQWLVFCLLAVPASAKSDIGVQY